MCILVLEYMDDDDDDDDEYTTDSEGSEAYEDIPMPELIRRRPSNPDLPDTVTLLHTNDGGKVYLVGTAHFSQESRDDVSKV